jgi:hypothetical protein
MIADVETALASLEIPSETGRYDPDPDGSYPDKYIVYTPLGKRHDDIADNDWASTNKGLDVNFYIVGDYEATTESAEILLKTAGFIIIDSGYIAREETGHHHYVITIETKEFL